MYYWSMYQMGDLKTITPGKPLKKKNVVYDSIYIKIWKVETIPEGQKVAQRLPGNRTG